MLTKSFLFVAIMATVHATGLVSTGVSTTSRRQDSDGNYGFSYEIVDANGASNSRMEIGDAHGNKQGNYHLIDTDGRARRVDYIADKNGYRAVVKTNEPGTARSAPAGVVVDSPHAGPVAPEVPVVVAPVAQPAPVVEPVAHPAPVIVQPVAHPAPVVVQPVAHPVPVTTTTTKFTVIHGAPVIQRPFVALPTRSIIVNSGLGNLVYGFGLPGSTAIGYNTFKG